MARIAVAGCFHETNSFAVSRTDRDAFQRRDGWLEGSALEAHFAGTRTVVGGVLDGARAHRARVVPIFGAYATPAGLVTAEAFASILGHLGDGLRRAGQVDGLLLELHGAMIVEGEDDPETVLLEQLRQILGPEAPIVAVMDLHANVSAARVAWLDALVGYRTNPHVDTYERGLEAVELLMMILDGRLEVEVEHRSAGIVAAPIAQRSDDPPLRMLLDRAGELAGRPGHLGISVHAGYAYADVSYAGLSFTATADVSRRVEARAALDELVELAQVHRKEFERQLPDEDESIRSAVELAARTHGTVAVADTGDNINGGAPGDTTWLLHALRDHGGVRAATTMWDPGAVAAAEVAGVGGRFDVELGGKAEATSGHPFRGEALVRWTGDGTFENTGPMAHGARVSMGRAAVVSVGAIDVVVQSQPVQPNDPELFRCAGLRPDDYEVVVLKGAAAIRAGWSPLVTGFVDAGTRGVTDGDLRRLSYRRLRDVWPLRAMGETTAVQRNG